MSEKSHVVQDTDCQIQSWSEAIEVIEMLLNDLQIIKTSSEKLYDENMTRSLRSRVGSTSFRERPRR